MDEETVIKAYLLFDDYLDVCLGLDNKNIVFKDIFEKKKKLKESLIHSIISLEMYRKLDSELFLEYVKIVSKD